MSDTKNIVHFRQTRNGKWIANQVGRMVTTDKGTSLYFDSIPVGEWDGRLAVVEPREREDTRGGGYGGRSDEPFDDGIPF